MEEQKQAKQQIQIDSDILNTLSKAVRVTKEKGNLDRDGYKKGINASKTKALFLLFEDALEEFKANSFYYENFSTASTLLKKVNYTIKDIEELCPILSQSYANETNSIGIFISAAINKIIKETDTINLDFAGIEVNYLGYCLTRGNLIIKGSVGDYTGHYMQSGSITIHGNAGEYTGDFMQSGSITIHGNAGDWTGDSMQSGSIIVDGNAGKYTGDFMQSGSITIHGNAGEYTGHSMEGGSIIVDGNAGNYVGIFSEGGEIKVNGEINGISNNAKAAIFCEGKRAKSIEYLNSRKVIHWV